MEITNIAIPQDSFIKCEGECGATEEHAMQFDLYDVMLVTVPRDKPFVMSDHHPILAGRLPDGQETYIFDMLMEDGLTYEGSGPTPEDARFHRRGPDGNLIITSPSPSDGLRLLVLRYDPDAYMHCEYYANKMKLEGAGKDTTGPFSWKLCRYLPAFHQPDDNENVERASLVVDGLLSDSMEDKKVSFHENEDACEDSDDGSLCAWDEDWRTAEEGSIISKET